MKILARDLKKNIEKWLFKGKILIIYGARQVGKTTLAKEILQTYGKEQDYYDCELSSVRNILEQPEPVLLKRAFGNTKLIVLDEAQKIANTGITLKILHDHLPDLQIVVTGSSSFDLANEVNEPLTGRSLEFILYPISLHELSSVYKTHELQSYLENLLIYGSYPEITTSSYTEDSRRLLDDLTNKYLYKDILAFETIKNSKLLAKLLQLIAFQIGAEVSMHELAITLQISPKTVEKYLDLLEKAFVIFRLKAFSRNLRKEISKKDKIYFYDLGIRNSLIAQFNPLNLRHDVGALWENFCIVERLKYRSYNEIPGNIFYWRTHDKKEIDYIEENNGQINGYEFKWKPSKYKKPQIFLDTYKNSSITVIDSTNFWQFLVST